MCLFEPGLPSLSADGGHDLPQSCQAAYSSAKAVCRFGLSAPFTPLRCTYRRLGLFCIGSIVFLFFTTLSLSSIAKALQTYGLESVSQTTMLTAPVAVAAQKFAAEADRISKRLGDSEFLTADETPIRIGKEWGYAWVFIGEYSIKFTVAGSGGGPVLDLHIHPDCG